MKPRRRRLLLMLAASILACGAATPARAGGPITLDVDASEAPRRIIHATLRIPATAGPLILRYPKWIPGEHSPSGPINGLAGLRIAAAGRAVEWRRDSVEMYAFRCVVPRGSDRVEVSLDYLAPVEWKGMSSAPMATAHVAVINWNEVLLYPDGMPAESLLYRATLRLPPGWKSGTALPVEREEGDRVRYRPVPLVTLVDSPVLAGAHFRAVPLAPEVTPPHELDLAAEVPEALEASPQELERYSRLVREAKALFGAHHYRAYHFLLALSDGIGFFGLEHHESSDNRMVERGLVEEERRLRLADLLPHEFAHSWNGKFRRPADLASAPFEAPMRTDLLWVYEGLTEYLGWVLTARSELLDPTQARAFLAVLAAGEDHHRGRAWRPLLDTAVSAPILFGAPDAWESWRRSVDFYDEGMLLWLDVDGLIRERTGGARSLDDFCRRFFGGVSGGPEVRTYTFEDVVADLNETAPYDWRGYFLDRITKTGEGAPLEGIRRAGWRLSYADSITAYERIVDRSRERTEARWSLGVLLDKDGRMLDVVEGSPAARAGVGPGMKLVAVNARRWTPEVLDAALRAGKGRPRPVDLLVENGDFLDTRRVSYHDGPRYPLLVRDAGRRDWLSDILAPKAAHDR
jgi:predicted metalloprotease with PDZ domain